MSQANDLLKQAQLDVSFVVVSASDTNIPVGECRMLTSVADGDQYFTEGMPEPWCAAATLFAHVNTPACFVFEVGPDKAEGCARVMQLIEECGSDVYLSLQIPKAWGLDDPSTWIKAESHDLLPRVGKSLFGAHFGNQLALALGVRHDTVRRWASGREAVPEGVWRDIDRLVLDRRQELSELRLEINGNPTRTGKTPTSA